MKTIEMYREAEETLENLFPALARMKRRINSNAEYIERQARG